MFRHSAVALLGMLMSAGLARAADVQGKLKSVNVEKKIIVLDVEGKDREFTVPETAAVEVQDVVPYVPIERLKDQAFKVNGRLVRIATEKKDNAEVVTKVVIYTGRRG